MNAMALDWMDADTDLATMMSDHARSLHEARSEVHQPAEGRIDQQSIYISEGRSDSLSDELVSV